LAWQLATQLPRRLAARTGKPTAITAAARKLALLVYRVCGAISSILIPALLPTLGSTAPA
jgi:hypothetical protein